MVACLSGRLSTLRLKLFPKHQLKLTITGITLENTDFRIFAWLNLK